MGYFFVAIAVIANVLASVSLKFALDSSLIVKSTSNWLAESLPYAISIFFYGAAFVGYATSLKFLPLHVAQPLTSAAPLVLISIISVVVFRESISVITAVGLLIVAIGLFTVGLGGRA
jgi:small multidrug resistance pump